MKHFRVGLLLVSALACASPVQAQLFFSRKQPPNGSQRVPELILTIKIDSDERKRQHAAEELRNYDAATYTEIVPVLADVLLNDKKPSVRLEALTSLARIRPVQPAALQAIEKAANKDEAWRVRWQAKTASAKLQLVGLTTKKSDTASTPGKKKTGDEPPVSLDSYLQSNGIREIQVQPVIIQPEPAQKQEAPRPLPSSVNQFETGTPPARAPLQPIAPTPTPLPTPAPPVNTPPVQQGPALFP